MEKYKTPPSLLELQLWMKWIVTDPRGAKEALTAPFPSERPHRDRYTSPPKEALSWISVNPSNNVSDRLEIYAEAYFTRVLESMKSDFQITHRVLGEISFQKLVSDYLKKHPSQTTNIGELGRYFPDYIASYDDLKEVPFLEALAKMEWLMIEAFYANDTGFLNRSIIGALTDEDWAVAKFILAPSIFLVESIWPLDQFWKYHDESIELDSIQFEPFSNKKGYLIFRENGIVSIEELLSPSFFILQKLNSGQSLISTLEESQNKFSEIDIASQIMNWFNDWVRRGFIHDLKTKSKKANL